MSDDGTLFLSVDGVDVDPFATAVTASDRGFSYGDGVFRTVRVRDGRVAAWGRHARKLDADLARLALGPANLRRIVADLDRLGTSHPDCIARISITAGASARGYRRMHGTALTTVVRATALPLWPAEIGTLGIALRLCKLRLADQPALAGVKHLNRLEQVLARAEWDDDRIAEGLTLDVAGHAICGTMSNLFIVEGGCLATPDLARCGVEGVQRGRIIDWARQRGIPATVEALPLERVCAADALILCNSVIGAWWVSRFNGRTYSRPAWHGELATDLERDD
ncbi:MAG: aminodeoxychorismate lyase [bacterium]|jgi:4-amino-4-deoxychorismate lyase|nr:aminodeoxychorismate lyase [Rhodocyclaceae bacterium]MCA4903276.1 aminodeoxychorismate lyase [Rhodocyclaceae bacterium]MCE2979617.1 aminodeoxychorismate lyase [Betaproteobacteria bacterium]